MNIRTLAETLGFTVDETDSVETPAGTVDMVLSGLAVIMAPPISPDEPECARTLNVMVAPDLGTAHEWFHRAGASARSVVAAYMDAMASMAPTEPMPVGFYL